MALKKKKQVVEETTPVVEENIEETAPLTPDEKEAIQADEKNREEAGASAERLRLATTVISSKFGLDDTYRVTKFNDKGKVIDLTLESGDFIVSVTIKDSDRHGMHIEQ